MARPSRLVAVVLIAASTLSYEIILVRIFAIEYFHHFAYMAIGVAMLGFGASGTMLALVGEPKSTCATETFFFWTITLTPLCLILSPTLVHQIALDPTQLAWNGSQWLRLTAVYALLALPFAVGALSTLLALVLDAERPGRTYGASFVGSGLGTLLALAVLCFSSPQRALAVPALVAAIGAISGLVNGTVGARIIGWITLGAACTVCVVPLWHLDVSPYKALPQVEAYPDAQRVAESPSAVGWVVAVEAQTFRYAPGLSLAYTGTFPKQVALFVDGEIAGATIAQGEDPASNLVFDWLPTALPYSIRQQRRVLVIGAGGGIEVQTAARHGATRITAVELHPALARYGRAASTQLMAGDIEIRWTVGDARSYVVRTKEQFDLISIGPTGGFGISAAGIFSLSEDFLHTVDAYEAFLRALTESGMLATTRWLSIPPRESIRVLFTVAEALRRVAPEHLTDGLVVLRSWGTATVVAKPAGFTAGELDSIANWARSRQFDVDWRPGLTEQVSTFNHLQEPVLFQAAAAAQRVDGVKRFESTYPFAVGPVDDARPYPHHFLRMESLARLMGEDRGDWLPFAEWGPITLVATLAQSTVLALLLLVVPVLLARNRGGRGVTAAPVVYFLAIGFAYMATEIAAIQQMSLLLGHPVYAVMLVLATLLICSGIGSVWSDRLRLNHGWLVNGALLLILLLFGVKLLEVVHLLQPTAFVTRVVVAALLVCPLALLMGIPFPHGIRLLTNEANTHVAWAWAANGFASVIAAPLAALIALERGSPQLFFLAAIAYGLAGVLSRGQLGKRPRRFT